MPDETISVAQGDVLTVTADAGSYGTVWSLNGSNDQWTVGAKSPLRLGAGLYRIETVRGNITHTVDSVAMAALQDTLPRMTDRIGSAVIIAKAIQDGRAAMSLQDKFARLAARAKTVPTAMAERADATLARFDAVEQRGSAAIDGLDVVVSDAERAAATVEDAVAQLTNGTPS